MIQYDFFNASMRIDMMRNIPAPGRGRVNLHSNYGHGRMCTERVVRPALARVTIAIAPDGYRVVDAIAELDGALSDHVVLLADSRNGKPLPPDNPADHRAERQTPRVLDPAGR